MADRTRDFRLTAEDMRILKEAGGELREYGMRIAELGYRTLLTLPPKADLFTVRDALHPRQIAPALQRSWRIISHQTERALIATGMITAPMDLEQVTAVDLANRKAEVSSTEVGMRDKALAYIGARYATLDFLGTPKATKKFDTAIWTTLVYTENSSLRGIFYQGIIYNDIYPGYTTPTP